jgi:hypothetical protein
MVAVPRELFFHFQFARTKIDRFSFSVIFGRLTTEDYSDATAADPRIDELRAKVS